VARPGRCGAAVEFVAFPAEEAAAWLEERGLAGEPRSGTLAALYARAEGREAPSPPQIGFGA
jgi:hypothetical protein